MSTEHQAALEAAIAGDLAGFNNAPSPTASERSIPSALSQGDRMVRILTNMVGVAAGPPGMLNALYGNFTPYDSSGSVAHIYGR